MIGKSSDIAPYLSGERSPDCDGRNVEQMFSKHVDRSEELRKNVLILEVLREETPCGELDEE